MREEIWTEKIFKDDAGYFLRITKTQKQELQADPFDLQFLLLNLPFSVCATDGVLGRMCRGVGGKGRVFRRNRLVFRQLTMSLLLQQRD